MNIERYMTKGIQERIPLELQILLWELQTKIRHEETRIDYLQVYELKIIEKNNKREQVVLNRSEDPKYEAKYTAAVEVPLIEKLFIIEERYKDRIIETMLLAEEY